PCTDPARFDASQNRGFRHSDCFRGLPQGVTHMLRSVPRTDARNGATGMVDGRLRTRRGASNEQLSASAQPWRALGPAASLLRIRVAPSPAPALPSPLGGRELGAPVWVSRPGAPLLRALVPASDKSPSAGPRPLNVGSLEPQFLTSFHRFPDTWAM